MGDEFVPLWELLRPAQIVAAADAPEAVAHERAAPLPPDCADAIARARRFRAALCDALEVAVHGMLRGIAHRVLGRELRLAPCDVANIVRGALARHAGDRPITVHAHRDDLADLEAAGMDCIGDETLLRGDVVLRVRSGTIDLRLRSRLDALLNAEAA